MKISRQFPCCPAAATALATVRELAENATVRPSPFHLHCVPFHEFELHPISAGQARRLQATFFRFDNFEPVILHKK
jgi:methylphosphotriester-DNA--protein-cysteine methyltransferase